MEATCDACKRENCYVQRDHRVPEAFGGARKDPRNIHPLCMKCHQEKTTLEMRLRVGANNPPTPYDRKCKDRWVELAFPEPTSTEVLTYWSEWLVASGDMPASELQDFLEQARQLEEQP